MTNECLCRKGEVRERHTHGLPQEHEDDLFKPRRSLGHIPFFLAFRSQPVILILNL